MRGKTIPLLLIDFYKATHHEQYPKGLTFMASYYTPRMSRLKDTDKVTLFGLQGFIKEYLIDMFDEYFFCKTEYEVIADYTRVLDATLGIGSYESDKIRDLHKLGYLPLQIRAVPEGTRTAIGVPQIEISNTHPNFVWLVNTIETMLSCTMWHTQISAEVGYRYRQIVNKYHEMSCDESVLPASLLGDFSMRGQHSVESATKSSAAWLLSFRNTATVPAIMYLEDYYNCDCEKDIVGLGAISTEHSVMCSNFAVDGDEKTQIRRLLTEIYPNHSFSMVSDSYDYWNLVTNILPELREEIMNHNGCISIRGDSGDPVEVIAGIPLITISEEDLELLNSMEPDDFYWEMAMEEIENSNIQEDTTFILKARDEYIRVKGTPEWSNERGSYTGNKYNFIDSWNIDITRNAVLSPEEKGTVWTLWDMFGGTINSKRYKVLDPHVKAIYGDSITPQRCEEIYKRLTDKGFAVNNTALGVGSFSMMCLETIDEDGEAHYNPYTRDTFGIAVKATYAEDECGNPIMIYKQPKALSWKKSQKGCCSVSIDGQSYIDGLDWENARRGINLLTTVFKDGCMTKEYSLNDIRQRLHGGKF